MGQQGHVADPAAQVVGQRPAEQTLVDELVRVMTQVVSPYPLGGRVGQVAGCAGPGVEPPEATLAGHEPTMDMISRPSSSTWSTSISPWSAVTTRTAPEGSSAHQVAHQPVDGPELGVVLGAPSPLPWATLSMPS